MNVPARWRSHAAVRGFTLIELLLTVVLVMLLLGSLVVNFSALQSTAQLDEAAAQLESAIRYARAHAASTGCRVRLTFEELVEDGTPVPLGNIFAEWESDPLRKPGVFEPLHEVTTLIESLMQAAQIEDVRALDGSGTAKKIERDDPFAVEEEAEISFAPITFFPDGSSDSAEIILASRSEEETRRISLTIVGATGVIRTISLMDAANAEEQEMVDWLEE